MLQNLLSYTSKLLRSAKELLATHFPKEFAICPRAHRHRSLFPHRCSVWSTTIQSISLFKDQNAYDCKLSYLSLVVNRAWNVAESTLLDEQSWTPHVGEFYDCPCVETAVKKEDDNVPKLVTYCANFLWLEPSKLALPEYQESLVASRCKSQKKQNVDG